MSTVHSPTHAPHLTPNQSPTFIGQPQPATDKIDPPQIQTASNNPTLQDGLRPPKPKGRPWVQVTKPTLQLTRPEPGVIAAYVAQMSRGIRIVLPDPKARSRDARAACVVIDYLRNALRYTGPIELLEAAPSGLEQKEGLTVSPLLDEPLDWLFLAIVIESRPQPSSRDLGTATRIHIDQETTRGANDLIFIGRQTYGALYPPNFNASANVSPEVIDALLSALRNAVPNARESGLLELAQAHPDHFTAEYILDVLGSAWGDDAAGNDAMLSAFGITTEVLYAQVNGRPSMAAAWIEEVMGVEDAERVVAEILNARPGKEGFSRPNAADLLSIDVDDDGPLIRNFRQTGCTGYYMIEDSEADPQTSDSEDDALRPASLPLADVSDPGRMFSASGDAAHERTQEFPAAD